MENKEKDKKKKTGLLLSILGVISLILITAGVTYAFFSYAKQGTTENTIRTGTITFVYNEKTSTGLNIENALPKSDTVGMTENANGFEFTVTSNTPSTAYIDYIVTARKSADSTLPENQVKLYLTSPTGADAGGNGYGSKTGSAAGSITTFNALDDVSDAGYNNILTGKDIANNVVEKVIYKGRIAAGSSNDYTRTFKLNMWLLGAEEKCFINNEVASSYATQEACEAATPTAGVWRADDTGIADYSAYEFVKLSALTVTTNASCSDGTSATEAACTQNSGTWTPAVYDTSALDFATLKQAGDIIQSVPYYSGVEGNTLNASDYTRLKYVNQTTGKLVTVAQGGNLPSGEGWEANEQYYPLNGQKFSVTINVYAEGFTTYAVPGNG